MDLNRASLGRMLAYLATLVCVALMNNASGIPAQWNVLHLGVISSAVLFTACLQWRLSVRRRFPQKQMRGNITLFVDSLMLLCVLRAVKYAFTPLGGDAARYLWYAYYIPFTFGPVFLFLASLSLGRADDDRISKKWNLLFLPPTLLSASVLTNDLHRAAFGFPNGFAEWETCYTRGAVYYLAAAWIVLTVLGTVFNTVRSTFSRRLFKTAWLPAAVAAGMVIYLIIYVSPVHGLNNIPLFSLNDFLCFGSMALLESFVIARIIVSNQDYPAIFAASTLNAGIADQTLQVQRVSAQGVRPQPQQLDAAKNGETVLSDGETVLKARPVQGGWFYWTENLSELRRLREALNDTADYLNEENTLMQLTSELNEERRAVAGQLRLYDSVAASLSPQLDRINEILQSPPEKEASFRETLKTVGVLIAYAKRLGFLLLESRKTEEFTKDELLLCMEESARALRLADVKCEVTATGGMRVPANSAVALYEAFEALTEYALPALVSLELALSQDKTKACTTLVFTAELRPGVIPQTALRQLAEEKNRRAYAEGLRFEVIPKTAEGGDGA